MAPAQGYVTGYAPRLRQYANTLLQPVSQTQSITPTSRTTKRGTTVINYADDAYDDDDFDDSEGPRRPTGLRSLRREELEKREPQHDKLGREAYAPVQVQAIYRDWMIRKAPKPMYVPSSAERDLWLTDQNSTDQQLHIQAQLPLTLIPIRVDLDVPAHQPDSPYPLPPRSLETGMNLTLPMFRRPEMAPAYKIRDVFLWNLHENLITPDDFAMNFVRELDLPNQNAMARHVSQQIQNQLEDYAGVALHPLFHTQQKPTQTSAPVVNGATSAQTLEELPNGTPRAGTPRPASRLGLSRGPSVTPAVSSPVPTTPQPITLTNGATVSAQAEALPQPPQADLPQDEAYLNPDDMYRCIITLSIYLSSRLYQDRFEWSLLHPPGAADAFAKQTCADMGLGGEWVLAITHAIYEAVLRLKKEACEGGTIFVGWAGQDIDNQAVKPEEGAGWRYDDQDFGADWEPKFEALSKEETEKREGDRERQLRRLRRETAKFSSSYGTQLTAREQEAQARGSYFDAPGGFGVGGGDETPLMGRGERNRKKRRFRSPSPVAKASTPAETASAAGAAWGGEANKLQEYERQNWRCKHCLMWGSAAWAVRDGPAGPRVSPKCDLLLGTVLTCVDRLCAIIVVYYMKGTKSCQRGRKTCTSSPYHWVDSKNMKAVYLELAYQGTLVEGGCSPVTRRQ